MKLNVQFPEIEDDKKNMNEIDRGGGRGIVI